MCFLRTVLSSGPRGSPRPDSPDRETRRALASDHKSLIQLALEFAHPPGNRPNEHLRTVLDSPDFEHLIYASRSNPSYALKPVYRPENRPYPYQPASLPRGTIVKVTFCKQMPFGLNWRKESSSPEMTLSGPSRPLSGPRCPSPEEARMGLEHCLKGLPLTKGNRFV
jgi:hypothetical protein